VKTRSEGGFEFDGEQSAASPNAHARPGAHRSSPKATVTNLSQEHRAGFLNML
jgi:hypothetical protein